VDGAHHRLLERKAFPASILSELGRRTVTGGDRQRTVDVVRQHDDGVDALAALVEERLDAGAFRSADIRRRDDLDAAAPIEQNPQADVGEIDLDELEAEILPEVRGVVLMLAFDAENDVVQAWASVSQGKLLS